MKWQITFGSPGYPKTWKKCEEIIEAKTKEEAILKYYQKHINPFAKQVRLSWLLWSVRKVEIKL